MGELLAAVRDGALIVSGVLLAVILFVTLRRLLPLLADLHALSREMRVAFKSFQDISEQLEETVVSARALTDAVTETHQKSIGPVMRNVEEISRELSEASRQIAETVDEGARFSRSTLRQATYYRDKVFRPLIQAASFWSGARAVMKALPGGRLLRSRRSRRKERSK